MTGILIWNGERPDIAFDNGALYGGLHCGECFEIFSDCWKTVRLELYREWVIVEDGKMTPIHYGLRARI
jgi:hypothetical protein